LIVVAVKVDYFAVLVVWKYLLGQIALFDWNPPSVV
jgi:hypothetical protein